MALSGCRLMDNENNSSKSIATQATEKKTSCLTKRCPKEGSKPFDEKILRTVITQITSFRIFNFAAITRNNNVSTVHAEAPPLIALCRHRTQSDEIQHARVDFGQRLWCD